MQQSYNQMDESGDKATKGNSLKRFITKKKKGQVSVNKEEPKRAGFWRSLVPWIGKRSSATSVTSDAGNPPNESKEDSEKVELTHVGSEELPKPTSNENPKPKLARVSENFDEIEVDSTANLEDKTIEKVMEEIKLPESNEQPIEACLDDFSANEPKKKKSHLNFWRRKNHEPKPNLSSKTMACVEDLDEKFDQEDLDQIIVCNEPAADQVDKIDDDQKYEKLNEAITKKATSHLNFWRFMVPCMHHKPKPNLTSKTMTCHEDIDEKSNQENLNVVTVCEELIADLVDKIDEQKYGKLDENNTEKVEKLDEAVTEKGGGDSVLNIPFSKRFSLKRKSKENVEGEKRQSNFWRVVVPWIGTRPTSSIYTNSEASTCEGTCGPTASEALTLELVPSEVVQIEENKICENDGTKICENDGTKVSEIDETKIIEIEEPASSIIEGAIQIEVN